MKQQYGFDASGLAATKSEEPQQSKRKSSLHESTANSYAECYPGYVHLLLLGNSVRLSVVL